MKTKYLPKTQLERLGWVAEECGEVLAGIGKTLRHGIWSSDPTLPFSEREFNGMWVLRELQDLKSAIAELESDLQREFRLDREAILRERYSDSRDYTVLVEAVQLAKGLTTSSYKGSVEATPVSIDTATAGARQAILKLDKAVKAWPTIKLVQFQIGADFRFASRDPASSPEYTCSLATIFCLLEE